MLCFVTLLGLILRLTYINKPEGLWNDEYVSWYVSATPINNGFLHEILHQCHMPLYYLYLKPFAGCSDIILRLTSVFAGIIAIPIMYKVGKEFSEKTAKYASAITAVLPFLVYYSQEVRFYSLLFTFSALSLLFTIRLIKNGSKKNICGYTISMLLILSTHILGIIYCIFNLGYVFCKTKKISKVTLLTVVVSIILIAPFSYNILNMLPTSQWWGKFTYTNLLFLFSDYFSPILTNHINAPPVFFYNKNFAIQLTIPTLIAIIGICFSRLKGLIGISLGTIAFLALLASTGKIVFITKYSIEILPILILAVSYGFDRLKKTGLILFAFFIAFHIASIFTPHYVTKTVRNEGNRIPAEIINARQPDKIIFTYYEPERFKRYQTYKAKETYYISKINRYEYAENPEKILNNIHTGETVSIIFLNSVSFFDDEFVRQNKNNRNIPEMFIIFSNVKNKLIKTLDVDFADYKVDTIGSWTVITARKIR